MIGNEDYKFLSKLFLRAPYYSFAGYDLSRLPEVLLQQDFRNAIWLASPEFYKVLRDSAFDYVQLEEKQRHTLHKYYNRICFRPTPFGSFASFTLLEWGSGHAVRLSGKGQLHLLADQQLIQGISEYHNGTAMGDQQLTLNPCLYRMNKVFRYIKSAVHSSGRYEFSLEAIEAVNFHSGLFALMRQGEQRIPKLLDWICKKGSCTREEAGDYLMFLCQQQVLLGRGQGSMIQRDAGGVPFYPDEIWNTFWRRYQSIGIHDMPSLADVAAGLEELLPAGFRTKPQYFYAAGERPLEKGGPDRAEQSKLREAFELLRLLNAGTQPRDLTAFITEFRKRFDQAKIPLLAALDSDKGINYGNLDSKEQPEHILEGIRFPENASGEQQLGWTPAHQLLFRLWTGDKLRDPWAPIELGQPEIRELKSKDTISYPLPQTQALMYRNTGEHILIEQAGGVTGVSLVGRFSCFSESVHEFCRELATIEQKANPQVVFADIGQLSHTHVDNINRRKPAYDFEIPINVFSDTAAERQIRPDDLVLSLENDQLILESVRLGRRVIPRLASAYNFRNNHLPLYRLLCDLQYQGLRTGFSFDLESYFPGLGFYPRVSSGQIVISLAKWIFNKAELLPLRTATAGDGFENLKAFRVVHHLPRHISLGAGDQQLVFDLAIKAEGDFFLQCIRGTDSVTIQEYLCADRSVLTGNKPLAGQYIAFLAHQREIYTGKISSATLLPEEHQRTFLLGSEWLYLKLFCSPRLSNEILIHVVRPFLAAHKAIIRKWFFIRYTESGYHIRLRIHAQEKDLGILLQGLKKRMVASGFDQMIRNYQGDTYEREMERYGRSLIPLIEEIFHQGSELVSWYLKASIIGKTSRTEFEFGMSTAARMLTSFYKDDHRSLDFVKSVATGFLKEFKADKPFRMDMDSKYREHRSAIELLLSDTTDEKALRPLCRRMAQLAVLSADHPVHEQSALLADTIHMQLNRTFSNSQRQQELLVYYCLDKYLTSRIARQKRMV